jgi:hypothetical protein
VFCHESGAANAEAVRHLHHRMGNPSSGGGSDHLLLAMGPCAFQIADCRLKSAPFNLQSEI